MKTQIQIPIDHCQIGAQVIYIGCTYSITKGYPCRYNDIVNKECFTLENGDPCSFLTIRTRGE